MKINGSCHCGAVTIETEKDSVPGIVKCYCFDCQKHLGNYAPWVVCAAENTTLEGSVGHYKSSESAERLFCTECGSSLAKAPIGGEKILISAGAFTQPLDLVVIKEVFTEDKQDWM